MPAPTAPDASWENYCSRDVQITYHVVSELLAYIGSEKLGNWQPTGAGMAYATWRHKFLTHKILVHDDADVIAAEREAMHTGRAEAWRHGVLDRGIWTEVDMRDAYVRIAAESALPVKLKFRTGRISVTQYNELAGCYRILAKCRVDASMPCVPVRHEGRTLWPAGTFSTWLWDCEIALLKEEGQAFTITDSYVYSRAPVLHEWAKWILSVTGRNGDAVSPVVRTWAKHCGRALIGRLSLRAPSWEQYGENPGGETGISHMTDAASGVTSRLMHVGDQTLIETARGEGKDSLPQITGWVMAECRARLWRAMRAAGLDHLAHVDTDSLLVDAAGLGALREALGAAWGTHWAVKGSWRRLVVYGPRNYRAGPVRKVAGVPARATEVLPNVFRGERWSGLATDMEAGRHNRVTIEQAEWVMRTPDPRRADAAGGHGFTVPRKVGTGV
jgi:DNA polymerase type B, organellar and viral